MGLLTLDEILSVGRGLDLESAGEEKIDREDAKARRKRPGV
jgi:hypothetical protein